MSQYPQQIDNNITLPISDAQTALTPSLLNKLRDAIYKIELELGVFPSGDTYADVRSRLDAMEGRLGNTVSISGDLGGNSSSVTVIGIAGIPVIINSIQNNQTLIYDNSVNSWVNRYLSVDNLTPPFGFDMFTSEASYLELGQTLSNPAFTVTFTDQNLYLAGLSTDQDGYVQNVISNPTSFSSVQSYTKNNFGDTVTFTLSCSPTNDPAILRTDSITFTWCQRNYWGSAEIPMSFDAAFIQGLSDSQLAITKNKTFQVNSVTDQYIYFCCRSAYGNAAFSVHSLEGGFSKVATVPLLGEMFDIYQSDNPNLGQTSVTVS